MGDVIVKSSSIDTNFIMQVEQVIIYSIMI
jgi:hypothetical protein